MQCRGPLHFLDSLKHAFAIDGNGGDGGAVIESFETESCGDGELYVG